MKLDQIQKNDISSEQVLNQSQSLRMMLHDLRSPLSVIQSYLKVASTEDWFDNISGEGQKIFSVLSKNADYMSDLINDLAENEQLSLQTDHLALAETDLNAFITEINKSGQNYASAKDITFNCRVASDVPKICRFDVLKIKRALDNLITNAVKFSRPKTTVTLEVNRNQSFLEFNVCDHGLGIPEDELPKLFHEFGKTSVRPTNGESSTGLGLAIAKKIALQHRGSISVKSKVDVGSTFTLRIPLDNI